MWKKFAVFVLTLAWVAGSVAAKPVGIGKSQALTGELRRIVSDDFQTGNAVTQTLLRLDNGKYVVLHGADPGQVTSGRVTVTGMPMDAGNLVVHDIQQVISYRASAEDLASGPQSTLVVLTKYTPDPTPSYGLAEVGSVIDATADFWAEDSYDKFSLVPSYLDWTGVSEPGFKDLSALYPLVVDAVDAGVDFSQVEMLIIIGDLKFPSNKKGQAFLDPIPVDTDEGPQTMRVFMADADEVMYQPLMEFVVKHELSHTMDLQHSAHWDCGNESLALEGCNAIGSDSTNILRPIAVSRPAHHTHALQKLKAGYIDELQVPTVTETGIYTIDPLALPPGPGIRGLRLAAPDQTPLWIEYRQPIGLDLGMDDAAGGQTSTIYDGALITLSVSGAGYESALVDADFTQGNPFDGIYLTLLPGETLEDPFSGDTITTISATPSALTVAVEIDCVDRDGDGYGVNCLAGEDCDDNDPAITTSGPADVYIPTGEYLSFGDVRIDDVAYMPLEIVNNGCETLALLGINWPDPDFVPLNKVLTVPAKSTRTIWIRFTPSALGPDRSDILMQTSDPDEQWVTVIAIANAVTPQELDYSPGSFSVLLPTGGQATELLTVENLGGNALNYWIQNHGAVPWLDIDGDEAMASIPGFGQNQVKLNFNTDGQCSATGSVTLRMLTNDDDEPEVFIPVDWEVYAAPDLTFNRDPAEVIDFPDPGTSRSLRIDNDGCLPLTIQDISSSVPATFSVLFGGPVSVAPGESYTRNVTFQGCPRRSGIAQCGAQLSVQTDDPDEAGTSFLLFGTGFAP